MYIIVETGNKQYKVEKGDKINVEYLRKKIGEDVALNVKFAINNENKIVAKDKVKVTAEVIKNFKDKKVIAFKFKKRKNYHLTKGHRQLMTQIMIKEIKI